MRSAICSQHDAVCSKLSHAVCSKHNNCHHNDDVPTCNDTVSISRIPSSSSSSMLPPTHSKLGTNTNEKTNSSVLRDWLSSSLLSSSVLSSSTQPAGGGHPMFEQIGFCWTIPQPSCSGIPRGETVSPLLPSLSSPPSSSSLSSFNTQHQHLCATLSKTHTSEEYLLRKTFQCLSSLTRQETVLVTSTMEWKFCNGFVGIKRIKEKQALLEIDKLRKALQLPDSIHLVPVSLESDHREMFLINRRPRMAAQKHIQVEANLQTFLNKHFSTKHSDAPTATKSFGNANTNTNTASNAASTNSSQPTFSENIEKHMHETWQCNIIDTIVSSQINQANLQQNARIRQVSLHRTFIFPLVLFQTIYPDPKTNPLQLDGSNNNPGNSAEFLNPQQQWSIHLDCTWFADMFEDEEKEEEEEEQEKKQADTSDLDSSSEFLSTCMFRALILYNNVFLKPHPDLVQVKLVAGCVAQSCGKPNPGGVSSTLEEKDKPFSEYTEKILLLVEQIHKSLYLSTSFS